MARMRAPENMTYSELTALRARVDRLLGQKKNEARSDLRVKMAELAKAQGMSLEDVVGGKKGRRQGKAMVAIKYRDPKNPENTWTGRGRTPRWMVAALKRRRVKKEHFLI
jgi:DNA-binding protein H-NS